MSVNDNQKNFRPFRHRWSTRASQSYIEPFIEPCLYHLCLNDSEVHALCSVVLVSKFLWSLNMSCEIDPPSLRFFWISLVVFRFNWIFVRHHLEIKSWAESTPKTIQNGAKLGHKFSCALGVYWCVIHNILVPLARRKNLKYI